MESKKCKHCDKIIYKGDNQSNNQWKKRKFCTSDCAWEYGWVSGTAKSMNVPYEYLKKKLIEIAEEYHDTR